MSDTVKLIIEIPKELYENKKGYLTNMDAYMICKAVQCKAVQNGTLLDDVKAEIQTRHDSIRRNIQYDNGRIDALEWVLDVLDNIGKESEEV